MYAEGWVTAPGYTGEMVGARNLDIEIFVNSGLFQGAREKGRR